MRPERLNLRGREWTRYFAPTLICAYLAALCAALIVISAFLPRMRDAAALTAAGLFGLILSGGLGLLFFREQRRALEYRVLTSPLDSAQSYERVRAAALAFGWRLAAEERGRWLKAWTPGTVFADGELVAVECRGREVRIASIPDLDVGFSRAALKRCRAHLERLTAVVSAPPP